MVSRAEAAERARDARAEYDEVHQDLKVGDKIGSSGFGADEVYEAKNTGRIRAYDTLTGEMSWINDTEDNIRIAVNKRRADGSPVFTFDRSKAPTPRRGVLKCILHRDDPERIRWDGMGLPLCTKSNIPSQYDVERHAKGAHKGAYAAIQRVREQEKEDEDRELMRMQMRVLTRSARLEEDETVGTVEAPLYVSDKLAQPRRKRGRPRKDGR